MKKVITMLFTMLIVISLTAQNNGFNFNKTNDYSKKASQTTDAIVSFDGNRLLVTSTGEDWEKIWIESYRLTGVYKGEQMKEDTRGPQFSSKMTNIIKNVKSGTTITISNIQAKRVDYKNNKEIPLDPLVIEIK